MKRISKSGIFLVFAFVAVLVCGAAFAAGGTGEIKHQNLNVSQLKELYHEYERNPEYCHKISRADRIRGAIMGAFIGDALGVGCHWYYDYEQLWKDYGPWVDGYVDPKKEDTGAGWSAVANYRYKAGVRAGMNSQSGELLQVMLETVAENCRNSGEDHAPGEFTKADYIEHMNTFFNNLSEEKTFRIGRDPDGPNLPSQTHDGINAYCGRYTDSVVRANFDYWYNGGKKNGKWWTIGFTTSTSEGAQWAVILAALYRDPEVLFYKAYDFLRMWYSEQSYITTQMLYIMTVQALINNVPLSKFGAYMGAVEDKLDQINKMLVSHDDVAFPGNTINRVIKREHLWKPVEPRFATLLFGQDCHVDNQVRGAYYYAFKFCNDFNTGILTADNSGGNNMARAALTGALIGAMVGIEGIPKRFIDGLTNMEGLIPEGFDSQSEYLMSLIDEIVDHNNGVIPQYALDEYDSDDCG